MADIFVVANIAALQAIDQTLLATGSQGVVLTPGTNLPPCIYTLITSTLAETQPYIIRPTNYLTRLWAAQPGMVGSFAVAPSAAPPMLGYFWINTATTPRSVYVSVSTSSGGWSQI